MPSISERKVLDPPAPRTENRGRFRAERLAGFTESVIREMTRLSFQHKAVNLAQGFPDFPASPILKDAASDAIQRDINQYTITWGAKPFRDAIAEKYKRHYGLEVDPEREVTVCCGATEGMIASMLAVANPGDEVIVFEPFYENYSPDTLLSGAIRRVVSLRAPDLAAQPDGEQGWTFDRDELRRAFSPRTKAIIINSPNNPTGKVFSLGELEYIAELCQEFDALAITDEIYEHILFDGAQHFLMMQIPGMRDRSILINSLSKTYSVTGWRVGWVIASPDLTDSIRKVHDFLTVNAAAPLQAAGIVALALPDSYYTKLQESYTEKRDHMSRILTDAGFRPHRPGGAYYMMADISAFGFADDTALAMHMVENLGVAAVPGSCFFANPSEGYGLIRFCFAKKYETLEEAGQRLKRLAG